MDRVKTKTQAPILTQGGPTPVTTTVSAAPAPPPPKSAAEIALEYAKMDTSILIDLPKLPLSPDHDVADLVAFGAALRDSTNDMRVIVGDTDPEDWHPGWVKCLQKQRTLSWE